MAKRKIELFINVESEKEFMYMLNQNLDRLICADIYSSFAGPCTVLDHLFLRVKLDWGDGKVVLLRVRVDEIKYLSRFQCQSEPVFIFILNNKITRVFRGVNNILFAEVAKHEIDCYKRIQAGGVVQRQVYDLDEASPDDEVDYLLNSLPLNLSKKQQEEEAARLQRIERQAARKRHRAELMIPHLKHLNFVLFWPHAMHAHPELYERWDVNS